VIPPAGYLDSVIAKGFHLAAERIKRQIRPLTRKNSYRPCHALLLAPAAKKRACNFRTAARMIHYRASVAEKGPERKTRFAGLYRRVAAIPQLQPEALGCQLSV
jgi:hypothetical protein